MGLTLGGGTLYFGDVNNPDKAVSIKEVHMDEHLEDDKPVLTNININKSITATAKTRINRNTWLSLLYGRKITNNWLKMHGGIITRKHSRRRHLL